METFLDEHRHASRVGLLLSGGTDIVPPTPRILAAPVGTVV